MIPQTSFNVEKMKYIYIYMQTKISKESKIYKYVVTLIGISHHATICTKVANFEKLGFLDAEIFSPFGSVSPYVDTIS